MVTPTGMNDPNASLAPSLGWMNMLPRVTVQLPTVLSRARCYTNVRSVSSSTRTVGIGILIMNMQVLLQEQIYIKATMLDSLSYDG